MYSWLLFALDQHHDFCARTVIGPTWRAHPTMLSDSFANMVATVTRRVCSSSGFYGAFDCGGRWVHMGRLQVETQRLVKPRRSDSIGQWSARARGDDALPVHRVRQFANGAACQSGRRSTTVGQLQTTGCQLGPKPLFPPRPPVVGIQTLRRAFSPDSVWWAGFSVRDKDTFKALHPATGRCHWNHDAGPPHSTWN